MKYGVLTETLVTRIYPDLLTKLEAMAREAHTSKRGLIRAILEDAIVNPPSRADAPPKPEGRFGTPVDIRTTPALHRAVWDAAQKAGLKASSFIHLAVARAVANGRVPGDHLEMASPTSPLSSQTEKSAPGE